MNGMEFEFQFPNQDSDTAYDLVFSKAASINSVFNTSMQEVRSNNYTFILR